MSKTVSKNDFLASSAVPERKLAAGAKADAEATVQMMMAAEVFMVIEIV